MDVRHAASGPDPCGQTTAAAVGPVEVDGDGDPGERGPRPSYLVVLSGGIAGAMLPVGASGATLGRAPENPLRFPDASLSRCHARFEVAPDGQAVLTDLGSTNGSFLNGKRLEPRAPARLRDGDRLQFGAGVLLKFIQPDPYEERLHFELFERAVRDPLTHLFNRSYFLRQFASLADDVSARGLGVAVVMLDVDHFKEVNDRRGHDAGDEVLRQVAELLLAHTRPEDLVARYGGEEFVIALPASGPDLAIERAAKIRSEVALTRFRVGPETLRLTVSLGITYVSPSRVVPAEPMISVADLALYDAKNAGRDRFAYRPFEESSRPEREPTPYEDDDDGLLLDDD